MGLEFVRPSIKDNKLPHTIAFLVFKSAIIQKPVSTGEMFKSQMLLIIIITKLTLPNLKGLVIILHTAIQRHRKQLREATGTVAKDARLEI